MFAFQVIAAGRQVFSVAIWQASLVDVDLYLFYDEHGFS
jgi:hypothetical protein